MKYYLIAGERSGDLHGSNLMKALEGMDSKAEFRFFGGEYMQAVGGELVVDYSKLAFMGFKEVLLNLKTISGYLKLCKKDIDEWKPDVLILIDYAGFNLKMAKWAHKLNIRVVYYISPKVWAWNQSRAKHIKKVVDQMFVILPFEVDFYKQYDWNVTYVGNPVIEAVEGFKLNPNFRAHNNISDKPIVAVLPGSRQQEVQNILPTLKQVFRDFPEYQFCIGGVNTLDKALYKIDDDADNASVVFDQTYDLLANSNAAIVCSGTATLETALWKVPQVVVYKTSPFSYAIAKALVKVKYISLVNLIVGKEIVQELIQSKANVENISAGLGNAIDSSEQAEVILAKLGNSKASVETAKGIIAGLKLADVQKP